MVNGCHQRSQNFSFTFEPSQKNSDRKPFATCDHDNQWPYNFRLNDNSYALRNRVLIAFGLTAGPSNEPFAYEHQADISLDEGGQIKLSIDRRRRRKKNEFIHYFDFSSLVGSGQSNEKNRIDAARTIE